MRPATPLLAILLSLACTSTPRPGDHPDSTAASGTAGAPAASTPDSSAALQDTEWTLVAVGGQPVAGDTSRRPGFRLSADGRKVQGQAGCNRMGGTYELQGQSLKFGPLITTKMACPAMQTEQAFLKALDATTRYEIVGSNLTLFGADGAPVARLETAGGRGP
jgi:copper homeostasis protein (lipoprotein)